MKLEEAIRPLALLISDSRLGGIQRHFGLFTARKEAFVNPPSQYSHMVPVLSYGCKKRKIRVRGHFWMPPSL